MMELSIVDFFESGAHFGHKTCFWNPKMAPYIFGVRQGIHIIDLDQTINHMTRALEFLGQLTLNNGRIIVVGTKWVAQDLVVDFAERVNVPYVNYRWPGGMLTNFKTIRQSIKRLVDYEELLASSGNELKTKKERLQLEKEVFRLSQSFGGIKNMNTLPDAVIVLDVANEKNAVKEANKLGIPVIGIVDSNSSLEGIDYYIPGNDDSHAAIKLYLSLFAEVIEEARARKPKEEASESIEAGSSSVKVVRKPKAKIAKEAKPEEKKTAEPTKSKAEPKAKAEPKVTKSATKETAKPKAKKEVTADKDTKKTTSKTATKKGEK